MTFEICGFQQAYAMTLRMQKEVVKKGEKRLVTVCVDCTDLCILRWLVNFYPRMTKIHLEDGEWVSISCKKMQTDLPLIDISRNAFSERLRKLADFGVLKYRLDKGKVGTRALFAFGENYAKLVEIPERGQPDTGIGSNGYGVSGQPDTGIGSNGYGVSGQTDTGVGLTQHGVSGQPDNRYSSVCNSSVLDSDVSNIDNPSTSCKDYNNNNNNNACEEQPSQKATKEKKPTPERLIIPPTLEMVEAYCKERNNGIDPEAFIDYYAARGWYLNKKQKMVDWHAAVGTWERNAKERQTSKQNNTSSYKGEQLVTINGVQYIQRGLKYYLPNGSGVAVDPYAPDDLPY